MCKLSKKSGLKRIDPCMRNIINFLRFNGIQTLSCCCGHGKYPMSILIRSGTEVLEIFSNRHVFRKKKFYKKDKQGFYYVPEASNAN